MAIPELFEFRVHATVRAETQAVSAFLQFAIFAKYSLIQVSLRRSAELSIHERSVWQHISVIPWCSSRAIHKSSTGPIATRNALLFPKGCSTEALHLSPYIHDCWE